MRGEEVSREIPFIFSRAFSRHAAGERVGRAGEGFVCGWKRGGSQEAPGGWTLFPSWRRLKCHVGQMVRRWDGQVTAVTPGICDGQLGSAFIPLRSSAGCWDPPHPRAMGAKGHCTPRSVMPVTCRSWWLSPTGDTEVPGHRSLPQRYPGGLWVPEGARPGCCTQPREILVETQPCPHKGSLQTGLSPRWVRRFGAVLVQRLGLTLHPGRWGRCRSLGKSITKGRSHPLCLLGRKIPSGGGGGKPLRSPGDVGPSPPLPQTPCVPLV